MPGPGKGTTISGPKGTTIIVVSVSNWMLALVLHLQAVALILTTIPKVVVFSNKETDMHIQHQVSRSGSNTNTVS